MTTCGTAPLGSDTILWGGHGCPQSAATFSCQRAADLSLDPPLLVVCPSNDMAAGLKWINLQRRTVYIQVGLGPYTANAETAASGLTWCYDPPGIVTCSSDPRWSNSKSPTPSRTNTSSITRSSTSSATRSRTSTRTKTRTKVCKCLSTWWKCSIVWTCGGRTCRISASELAPALTPFAAESSC